MCAPGPRSRTLVVVVSLLAALNCAPAPGKSAVDSAADSVKDYLPDITLALVFGPDWDSKQSAGGHPLGTFEMEAGFGVLATVGTGDKQSWHGEVEAGMRKTAGKGGRSLVGSISTLSLMANGYLGFMIAGKADGYVGAGVGLARHEEDRGSDLALAYQGMVGVNYELTEEITANVGFRYFGTQDASLGRIGIRYRRPEVELGIGYEF